MTSHRQLVPAYFYPDLSQEQSLWRALCGGNRAPVGSVIIMNPASGPGRSFNADYAGAVDLCTASGQQVIGYVHTSYGRRSQHEVEAEVDSYFTFYPGLDGIFFDEMSNDPSSRRYYRALYDYVQTGVKRPRLVVGNPGSAATTDWQLATPAADVVVVFEDSWDNYQPWEPPAWATNATASGRTAHLVHGAPTAALEATCHLAAARHAGLVYVTDDLMPNPWDTLPSSRNNERSTR